MRLRGAALFVSVVLSVPSEAFVPLLDSRGPFPRSTVSCVEGASVVAVDGAVAVVATVVGDVVVDGVSYPFPLFRQPALTSAINRNSAARI